jgi:hypothetical protein
MWVEGGENGVEKRGEGMVGMHTCIYVCVCACV